MGLFKNLREFFSRTPPLFWKNRPPSGWKKVDPLPWAEGACPPMIRKTTKTKDYLAMCQQRFCLKIKPVGTDWTFFVHSWVLWCKACQDGWLICIWHTANNKKPVSIPTKSFSKDRPSLPNYCPIYELLLTEHILENGMFDRDLIVQESQKKNCK